MNSFKKEDNVNKPFQQNSLYDKPKAEQISLAILNCSNQKIEL
jgi:hypothetical protein